MPAKDNEIGPCRCPLCGGTASLRLSASGLAYIAMDCCKGQLFTRGPESDQLARDLLLSNVPAKPDPEPAAKAAPAPKPTPAAAPAAAPAPAPPPRMAWGILRNV